MSKLTDPMVHNYDPVIKEVHVFPEEQSRVIMRFRIPTNIMGLVN
jgi:hypothetical protein